ncbi:unnamed protein product [Lampetra planeri]
MSPTFAGERRRLLFVAQPVLHQCRALRQRLSPVAGELWNSPSNSIAGEARGTSSPQGPQQFKEKAPSTSSSSSA